MSTTPATSFQNYSPPPSRKCQKCGSYLEEGQTYCGQCGAKYKAPKPPKPDEEHSNRISDFLGALLVIPLGGLGCVLQLAIPALIIFSLVNGPDDTWNMVQQWIPGRGAQVSAECEGFDMWYNETTTRMGDVMRMVNSPETVQNASPAELIQMGREALRYASEQRDSQPPPAARELNTFVISGLNEVSNMFDAAGRGDFVAAADSQDNLRNLQAESDVIFDKLVAQCG